MSLRIANTLASYMHEFSRNANNYKNTRSEESLVLLNRSISLICTAKNVDDFTPSSLEVSKFFIDLHAIIDCLSTDTDVFWACITALQQASRNIEARNSIVYNFRFLPMLTKVLKKIVAHDKIQRLLALLQELTYGIKITWEEPYLAVLLELLFIYIYGENEELAMLSLSVLINLCYKNFPVICLLLRTVCISSFSKKIMSYGVLSSKMIIILSEDINTPEIKELHNFIKANFLAIEDCLKTWNVPHLRHITDFLMESEVHIALHTAMRTYNNYSEDIGKLLDNLESETDVNDSSQEYQKHQAMCFSFIFKLINFIFRLSNNEPDFNESINGNSNDSVFNMNDNVPRIFDLVTPWIESEYAGIQAINLLENMLQFDQNEYLAMRIAKDSKIMTTLILISENNSEASEHTTAILKLILTLLNQPKTEKLILSKITESYFDKVLAPLISIDQELLAGTTFTLAETSKYVFCLQALIGFSNIAKKAYFDKVCSLMQMQQFQYILAKAILSTDEELCEAVFSITQFEHFPKKEVAKLISQFSTLISSKSSTASYNQWPNLNSILKSNQMSVSKELEERLDALMNVIQQANENYELNNVATSQLIELYNYKISMLKTSENNISRRLEDASEEITNLSQQVCLQKAELEKYHMMNFKLHISQERLQEECKDLRKQKENLTTNITNFMKKLSEQNETVKINAKRLEVKTSEMIVLQKDLSEVKLQLETKTSELEQLQTTAKEYANRIEKLKKSIDICESDNKEKKRILAEKEKEIIKNTKSLDDCRSSLSKSENVVKLLEQQLVEKNEAIRSYENELLETEEMRKTILSLMESKRPKRK